MKSPSLKVASRILEAAGFDLDLRVHIEWVEHRVPGLDPFWVPNLLWSVDMPDCFATLKIPDLINDGPMMEWDMRDREQRKGVYEQLICCGLPQQISCWVDGPLLVDVGRARPPRTGPEGVGSGATDFRSMRAARLGGMNDRSGRQKSESLTTGADA